MSTEKVSELTEEEIAEIQAQNFADYREAERLNYLSSKETGLTGLENSSASADIDQN